MSPIVKYGGSFIVLMAVLGLIGVLVNPPSTPFVSFEQVVTLAEYSSLQTGMPYQTVTQLIGAPGTEASRNELAGIVTVMYMWQNTDGTNMNAMFQDDKLVQKAQFGLK